MWGCEAKQDADGNWTNPSAVPLLFDDEETYACPKQSVKENPEFYGRVFDLYGFFEKGFLLDQGAINDQASVYLRLMQIIDGALIEARAEVRSRSQ